MLASSSARCAARPIGAARRAFGPSRRIARPVAALKQLPDFTLETDASTPAKKVTLSAAVSERARCCGGAQPLAAAAAAAAQQMHLRACPPHSRMPSAAASAASLRTVSRLPAASLPPHKQPPPSPPRPQDIKKKGAVIFVYPKACTSGCTFQANGFKDASAALGAKGYQVYGLSADVPEAQASGLRRAALRGLHARMQLDPLTHLAQAGWKAEHGFGYPLLSDPDMGVLRQLGCVSGEGKIVRAHFVVAPGGAV